MLGLRPEPAPARSPDARVGRGIPGSGSSGTDPGIRFRSQCGRFGRVQPSTGPQEYLKCLKVGLRLPSGRQRKYPHLCHRNPCPPAAKKLSVTFPPNTLPTETHTNTPIPCTAASRGGGGGRKRSGRKGGTLPFQAGSRAAEKFFLTRDSETFTGVFPGPQEVYSCRREADAFLKKR